jgi:DNA-binding HxlR family transcriptional regulator
MKEPSCPTEALVRLIDGRWKLLIIHFLLQGPRRFNQLQRDLGGITHRTLAQQLRELETDGLVARHDHGTIPPHVDYELTPRGLSLHPILMAMHDWAKSNMNAEAST